MPADPVLRLNPLTRTAPPEPRSANAVPLNRYHELKSAVHQELIKRADLEKLGVLQ
jgi:hypothetical protein